MAVSMQAESSYDAVILKFNGITHLRIKRSAYRALQAWIYGENTYCVEVVLADNASIRTEYDTAEKWKWVIEQLERLL